MHFLPLWTLQNKSVAWSWTWVRVITSVEAASSKWGKPEVEALKTSETPFYTYFINVLVISRVEFQSCSISPCPTTHWSVLLNWKQNRRRAEKKTKLKINRAMFQISHRGTFSWWIHPWSWSFLNSLFLGLQEPFLIQRPVFVGVLWTGAHMNLFVLYRKRGH